jgi:hypothetical protein
MLMCLASQDADKWQAATEDEYRQHDMLNTWEVNLCVPESKPRVPSHMVLGRQRLADGSVK